MKHYGALYTFLSSRAIQIEVTYSLNTDSFIMCLSWVEDWFVEKEMLALDKVRLIRFNLGFCLELGLLNSETEIGTGVA